MRNGLTQKAEACPLHYPMLEGIISFMKETVSGAVGAFLNIISLLVVVVLGPEPGSFAR